MQPARSAPWLVAAVLLWSGPLAAEVRLEILPDGTKRIVGSGSTSQLSSRSPARPQRARPAPPEVEGWIREAAGRHSLDPDLIRAVIQIESGFNPRATSHKGAMGLMQLMPATAATLAVSDPYDPRQNIRGGVAYLERQLRRFGRTDLALAAYNAGPEAVARYGGIPPYAETRDYVEKVLRIHRHDPDFHLPRAVGSPAHSSGGTRTASRARPPSKPRTYLYRDPNGSLVMTTEPPG